MSQNYGELDMAELLNEAERLEAGTGSTDFLENFVRMPEKEGPVTVRLLPPAKGRKFYCATRTHRINNKNIHCPRVLQNINGVARWVDTDPKQPCVICKYYNELWKESEKKEGKAAEELQNQARKIKPIERYYYNCVVRSQVNSKTGETEKNVGPKILSIGKTLHQRIIRAIVGDASQDEKPMGDVTSVKDGRDFKIMKRLRGLGKDAYPNYDDSRFMDSATPLGEKDQVEEWLASLHDLAALRVLKAREEMATELKKHLGLIQDEATGFDMSEFQKAPGESNASLEEQVALAAAAAARAETVQAKPKPPVTKPAVSTPKPADEVLAEQDFLDELKNMQ